MELGLIGLVGHHVRQRVVQQQYIVCDLNENKKKSVRNYNQFVGTRNCTGASNGGVCLGSVIDTQLCDTNVSCSGEFELLLLVIPYFLF